MKKLFIIVLLLSVGLATAQTNVSGVYFTNTNWSISGSPYNVIGDVQIPSGVTLSIEPGVQVNFTGDFQILSKGLIIANGNDLSPILFKGNTAGKAMLTFRNTNLNNSQLSKLKFTGSKNAIQIEGESGLLTGSLLINYAELTNTTVQTAGNSTGASIKFYNSIITSSLIKGVYPSSELIEINNSTISNSTINSDAYNFGVKLNVCSVSGSTFLIGCCGGNIDITSSTILTSTFSDGMGTPVTGPLKISGTNLENCTINLPSANFNMTNSTFKYTSNNGIIFGNGIIKDSEISGNGNGTAIKITGNYGYNIGGDISLHKNKINSNKIGVTLTGANTCNIDSCSFETNSTYNIQNLSTKNITAKNNWWGTTNATDISAKIFDYYDDINYGIVDISDNLVSDYCTILLQVGANGSLKENNVILGTGSTINVTKGTSKTLTIVPNNGYEIATFIYNGSDVKSQIINNQYTTPIINTNSNLSVTFKKIIYKISIQTGGSGTMILNYYYGDTPSFDFTPSLGSKIKSIFYNGTDVTANLVGNVYTLPSITSNGTLVVTFVSISTVVNSPDEEVLKVYSTGTDIIVQGTSKSEMVKLYNLNGQLLQAVKSQKNGVIFGVQRGVVYLVKTKTKTFKVIL